MHTDGLIGAYLFASCLLQGRQSQIRILVPGGDATIADFPAAILTVISDACNLWSWQG
jgi:hypothetical protein